MPAPPFLVADLRLVLLGCGPPPSQSEPLKPSVPQQVRDYQVSSAHRHCEESFDLLVKSSAQVWSQVPPAHRPASPQTHAVCAVRKLPCVPWGLGVSGGSAAHRNTETAEGMSHDRMWE